jgi:hypothetical protein
MFLDNKIANSVPENLNEPLARERHPPDKGHSGRIDGRFGEKD